MMPARELPGGTVTFSGWLHLFYVMPTNPAQNQVSRVQSFKARESTVARRL
jgi:hypothetical protein